MTRFYVSNRSWYAEIQTTIENYRIDRCHCHATKKQIGNRPVEEAKRRRCCKRLIYKQFVQVSGFVADIFWVIFRNVSRTFVELCMGTPYWCTQFWSTHIYGRRKLTRTSGVHFLFSTFTFCFFTRELAYLRINISSNTWNGCTAETQEERLFFNERAFLFWCHVL